MLRKMLAVALFALLASAALAATETWKHVTLVDANCAMKIKDKPDAHTRACALECAASGYGILTDDGTFLKFDKAGSTKALAALKASKKTDSLRITLVGEREGDVLKVDSLTFD